MKARILMIVVLMGLSAVLIAQPVEQGKKKFHVMPDNGVAMKAHKGAAMKAHKAAANGLNLTDAQKEAFKQSSLAVQKQLQPLRNELGEAEAHQKTLVTAEKSDLNSINKNIEKIGSIRMEMAKIQVKHRLEMRAQLNDEQKLKFDMFSEKMKEGRGPKGMKPRRM